VHLREFPRVPSEWADKALMTKWEKIREVRRVITGALEIQRREKVIGASLEAWPTVHVTDPELAGVLKGLDLAEIAITSGIEVSTAEGPADAFRLDDVKGVAVVFAKAAHPRCARSWRYVPDVGSDKDYPDLSARDAQAMRERAAAGLA
jgi:isoleucyl-tRNA synthetase